MTLIKEEKPKFPLRLDIQFFADGDGDDPAKKIDEPGTPDDGGKKDEPKTFTQEELDEIVKQRVSREQKKLEKFADYDTIKSELDTFRSEKEKKELDELGEVEKAHKLTEAEKLRADKLESDYTALSEKIKNQAVKIAFNEEARKLNIEYIDDAMKLADLNSIVVDEEYNVSGMADVVKALVESKPFLAKSVKQDKDLGGPSNPKKETDKTKDQLLEEARQKAIRTGRQEDRTAYAKLKREFGI
ncbi:MAG: hypothetical protein ACQEUT_18220 [Bacillota bacterium]